MKYKVENLAAPGIVYDVPDELLPQGAWTDSRNVRYRDGAAEKCRGYTQALTNLSATAIWATPVSDGVNDFWVYANQGTLYAHDGTNQNSVSSISYNATLDLAWNGGGFHGFCIANEGTTAPQSWVPGLSNKFQPLLAWPVNVTTKVIRPFKDFLFALRVTDNGTYNPRLLRWSDIAAQAALPTSWDYTDPTNQAGIAELAQGDDGLVDCGPLRDSLMIYKDHSTWIGEYVGHPDVFGFRQAFSQAGLLTEHCFSSIGTSHLVWTDSDVIIHDGNSAKSILNRRMRRWLFARISSSRYRRCYMVTDHLNREVFMCFPEEGYEYPNLSLVWNWAEDTLHPFELATQMTFGANGILPAGGAAATFDNDSGIFDEDALPFDDQSFTAFLRRPILTSATGVHAFIVNGESETYLGLRMNSYAIRSGMTFSADMSMLKRVVAVYPKFQGTPNEPVNIYFGTRDSPSGTTTWAPPVEFVIGVDHRIDFVPGIVGRIFDLRIEHQGGLGTWRLYGYEVEYEMDGER